MKRTATSYIEQKRHIWNTRYKSDQGWTTDFVTEIKVDPNILPSETNDRVDRLKSKRPITHFTSKSNLDKQDSRQKAKTEKVRTDYYKKLQRELMRSKKHKKSKGRRLQIKYSRRQNHNKH
jgi:hypothetical protein